MNKKITLFVDALDCAGCISTIDQALKKLDIVDYSVSLTDKHINIIYDDQKTNAKDIQKVLKKFGYKGEIINED